MMEDRKAKWRESLPDEIFETALEILNHLDFHAKTIQEKLDYLVEKLIEKKVKISKEVYDQFQNTLHRMIVEASHGLDIQVQEETFFPELFKELKLDIEE